MIKYGLQVIGTTNFLTDNLKFEDQTPVISNARLYDNLDDAKTAVGWLTLYLCKGGPVRELLNVVKIHFKPQPIIVIPVPIEEFYDEKD